MIWIGTSGFQYPEWRGKFFPKAFPVTAMLNFYGLHFNSTEINYTFYRVPAAKTLRAWRVGSPGEFRFSLKAPRAITHGKQLRGARVLLQRFLKTPGTLENKFGVILFQLPPHLKKDGPLLQDFLALLPARLRVAFEFRHVSWFEDSIFSALAGKKAALCIAESEKIVTPVEFTAPFAYFRLRREDYTEPDLARWARVVSRAPADDAYIYFKHERRALGPKFAKRFRIRLAAGNGKGRPPNR